MDLETILCSDYIEHYVISENGNKSDSWKRSTRSILRSIAKVTHPQIWPVCAKTLKSINVADAYTEHEEADFLLAGVLACHRGKLDQAFAVVGSLGLGLTGAEISAVESTQITELADGRLAVCVDRKPDSRMVPVRASYTDLMSEVLDYVGCGRIIHQKYENAVANIVQRIVVEGLGRLSLSRARSTWLTAHLLAGTPLAALWLMAGPLSGNTLVGLIASASEGLTPEEAALEGLRA